MATRKEFQEWLNRFPEDTIIEFAIQELAPTYESYGAINFKTPNLDDNDYGEGWEFSDFTDNQFVKPGEEHFGKKYLKIGEAR